MEPALHRISATDREIFLGFAVRYFTELDPGFTPREEWKAGYFSALMTDATVSVRWIVVEGERAGFAVYGTKPHRYLPTPVGMVYEFYVEPAHRRLGVGRRSAEAIINELRAAGVLRVELEVYRGNQRGADFWASLGFRTVSERMVLDA